MNAMEMKRGALEIKKLAHGPLVAVADVLEEATDTRGGGTMNKMTEPVYDHDTAVQLVRSATGIAEDVVARVLLARDRYLVGLGIIPADPDDEPPEVIRATHPDLFPADHVARRFLSPALECEFVVRTTGAASDDVRAIQVADEAYMRTLGLIEDRSPEWKAPC